MNYLSEAYTARSDARTLEGDSETGWTFAPSSDFNGKVNLSYVVSDGNTEDDIDTSNSFMVFAVNDAPSISDNTSRRLDDINEENQFTISRDQLLDGVSDKESDKSSLAIMGVTATSGTIYEIPTETGESGAEQDTWMYEAAEDYNGRVTINYAIQDTEGGMTLASYYFDVLSVDDSPEQISQNTLIGFTKEEVAITVTTDQLLSSIIDRDTDKTNLTITNVSVADEAGSISDNQNGTWTFTPGQEVSGSIQLNYFVNDDNNVLNAKASIEVLATNDIPALTGNPATLQTGKEDTEYIISSDELLKGYTDGDEISNLEITALTTTGGVLEQATDGQSWKLTPNKDQTGNILLSYVLETVTEVLFSAQLALSFCLTMMHPN